MCWHRDRVPALAVELLGAVVYHETTITQLVGVDKCVLHILSKEYALVEHE